MKNPVIPFPGVRSDPASDEEEQIRAAVQELGDAAASDPIPERLRLLATELGRALDARQAELRATDLPDNGTDP